MMSAEEPSLKVTLLLGPRGSQLVDLRLADAETVRMYGGFADENGVHISCYFDQCAGIGQTDFSSCRNFLCTMMSNVALLAAGGKVCVSVRGVLAFPEIDGPAIAVEFRGDGPADRYGIPRILHAFVIGFKSAPDVDIDVSSDATGG